MALPGVGCGVAALVLLIVPAHIDTPKLRGYRAAERRRVLGGGGLLQIVWPLISLCAYYAERVPLERWKRNRRLQLRRAGEPWGLSPDELLGLHFAAALLGLTGGALFAAAADAGGAPVILSGVVGGALPSVWLGERAAARLRSIHRGLPPALDLIVLAMGAGLDFISAVRHVAGKWSDPRDPLCQELSRFLDELSLGRSRREALEQLAERAPTELVKAFVSNAIQAEQRGTPLVDVLRIQAEVARRRRLQNAETVAGRAGVLLLLPLILVFVATVLLIFGSLIVQGLRGQLL